MEIKKTYKNTNINTAALKAPTSFRGNNQSAISSPYAEFIPTYANFKSFVINKPDTNKKSVVFNSIYAGNNKESAKLREIFRSFLINDKTKGYIELQTFKAPYIGEGKIYQLSNGHKVVILPKPGPTVVTTFVKAGMLNEPPEVQGISHLLEHYISGRINKSKSANGRDSVNSMGVDFSGATALTHTGFKFMSSDCDESELAKILEISSKILDPKSFDKDLFEKEKDIILCENHIPKAFVANCVRGTISKFFTRNSNKGDYQGDEKFINNITKQKLIDYYNTWYTPDNMVTVIVGKVDPKNTVKCFIKNFGKQNNKKPKHNQKFYPSIKKEINKSDTYVTQDGKGDPIGVGIGYLASQNDDTKGKICIDALRYLTDSSFPDYSLGNKPSDPKVLLLTWPSICSNDMNVDIFNLLKTLCNYPIPNDLLDNIKLDLKKNFLKSNEGSNSLNNELGYSMLTTGDVKNYTNYLKTLENINSKDIHEFFKNYLPPDKEQRYIIRGKDKKNKADKKISFKGNLNKIDTSNTKEYNLDNNLQVIFDPAPGISLTSATLKIKPGKIKKHKPGTFKVLEFLLNGGPKILNNSIDLGIQANNQYIYLKMDCLPEKTLDSLKEIKKGIFNIPFTKSNFEDAKKSLKDVIKNDFKSSMDLVYDYLYSDYFHYNPSDSDILKNIENISLKDVKDLYNEFILNSKLSLVLTLPEEYGKKHQKELINYLEKNFPKTRKFNNFNNQNNPTLSNLKKKNIIATQSIPGEETVHIGKIFKIDEPLSLKEDASFEVLGMILGFGINSRLMQDFREKQRLSYHLGSWYLTDHLNRKEFRIELNTQTADSLNKKTNKDNLRKAFESIDKNLKALASITPQKSEIESSKKLAKNILLKKTETSRIRNYNLGNGLNTEYGINYLNKKLQSIDEVTPEDIQKAAKKLLAKNYAIAILANEESINRNKEYLSSLGEVKKV